MVPKPTYEELENRVKELEKEAVARERTEEALRDSEERFKQLAEQSRTIAWEVNSDGLYTYVSHLSDQILGYHPEEIIGKLHFYDLHPQKGREAFKTAVFELFARKESFADLGNAVQTKAGACVWMSTKGVPLLNPDGTLRGYRGLDTDITERRQAEEGVKASERFLQNIFDGIRDGISVLDRDLTIIRCNFQMEDWYPEHMPLAGKKCYRVYQGLDSPCPWCPSLRAMKTGEVHSEVVPYPSAEKPMGWLELSSFPLKNESGEVVNVIEHVKDITAKKQAEEELRAERERFRVLSENAPFGMVMIDRDGTFKYVNSKFKEIFGYDVSDIPNGKTWFKKAYPDPDHRRQAISAWLEDLASSQVGQKRPRVFEVECKDGSKKIINFIPVQLETGENLMACEDITSRKEAEAALKRSEAKYRTIFDSAQAAIFRTRISDGKLLECNNRFAQTYGYDSREECIAHYLSTEHYVDPGTRQRMLAQLAKSGEVDDFEAQFFRKDGSIAWIRFSARANPEEDFIEGIGYDITREKDAIAELRVSEEKYRSILESMEEGYYEVDIAGNLTFFNDSLCDMLGYPEHELMGMNYRKYTAAENVESVYKTFNRVFMTGVPSRGFDWEIIKKDGKRRSIEVSVSPIRNAEGVVAGFSGIVRDITEKRMLEFQLQRAQKMEALGLLAGGVAHDLNNILSGIVSYPELMLMDLPEDSPLRKPLESIHASGMRAADVVADLLTIARGVATGKQTLNLNSIVNEYVGSPEYQKVTEMHPLIHFETDLAPDLLNMSGSPIHLKKSLMNLVINASEAIEGGGTVKTSTFNRYLDEPLKGYDDVRTGEYAVLSVSDNGHGISSKDMERIFEPFYTKKVMGRSGTGLGLTVVWNTVQDHNGYINVRTSEKGTVFELYFPVTREDLAAVKEADGRISYLGHGERILVVDDEESQREIAIGILTKLGYHAEAVSSGEEAIAYVKENPVDLIVLDMVMPKGVNGHETYKEIVKVRPGQKAIIASGYAQTEEVTAAQDLGAGKYVKKPYTLENIGLAVKEELEK